MSFKRKVFSFITLIFAIIALTTFVSAQDENKEGVEKKEVQQQRKFGKEGKRGKRGRRGFRGHRGGRNVMRMLRGIELTEAQRGQIKTLVETSRATNRPLREEMREIYKKHRNGESLTEADKTRLQQIRTDMKASSEQLKATILGLLTPEQTAKLEQIKAEREQRMQERRRRWEERKRQRQQDREKKEDQP